LNPAKCTFGVGTGKLLGFIVNERGIELDPDKVKAIRDMPAPKTEMEGQLHSPIDLSIDGYLQPNIQTPMDEPKYGMESRMLRSLRESQAEPGVTSCSRSNNTWQTLNIVLNGVEGIHGGHPGIAK
ncbi:hypothetical protein CR513_24619, partial [Mucuna pruriens]